MIDWVRDHRSHHKFSDTNGDPHNSRRGFFFSHIGWLMCKKHPEVAKYGKTIDLSDVKSDPMLRWQHKYYVFLTTFGNFLLPIFLSVYIFGENYSTALLVTDARISIFYHVVFSVNSVSHLWGFKPFEKLAKHNRNLILCYHIFFVAEIFVQPIPSSSEFRLSAKDGTTTMYDKYLAIRSKI